LRLIADNEGLFHRQRVEAAEAEKKQRNSGKSAKVRVEVQIFLT
jgi:hypothetical protein